MNEARILDISWGTILKFAAIIVSFYIIFLIKDILIWFLFALIISVLFSPTIEFLEKRRVPRVLAVVTVYLAVFGFLSLFLYSAAILFLEEVQQFSHFLPQYLEKMSPILRSLGLPLFESTESFLETIGGNLERVSRSLANVIFSVFGGIFSSILVLTMAIFLSLERRPVERFFYLFFPKNYEAQMLAIWARCQKRVSAWFLTRLIACAFVGGLSYLVFLLFNTKYPFSLGLVAGVLNFIPVVGPMATGIIIFLVAFLDSTMKAVFVLVAFILIQQVENNIITPILSKKFLGLSPILVLISLAIGGTLWGILGALLSVPLAGIVFEFSKEFLEKKKDQKEKAIVV